MESEGGRGDSTLPCLEIFVVVSNEAVLLEPSVYKQAMLLNIIKCTGEPPSAKYYLAQNVNSVYG